MADALRMRQNAGLGMTEAICVYDLAHRLGIEVRFVDIGSMEGVYLRASPPTILLTSLRPSGRRVFNCAHELGHHNNGDGNAVDDLIDNGRQAKLDAKEFAANCFAGALLMPKTAVERAFRIRGSDPRQCTPDQVYVVSNYFGVGYSTLIHHMHRALGMITNQRANLLAKTPVRQARKQALGWESVDTTWFVDPHWVGRAIDVEVDDCIYVEGKVEYEEGQVELVQQTMFGQLFRAVSPGVSSLADDNGWTSFIRIAKRGYVGRAEFRHLEESDD